MASALDDVVVRLKDALGLVTFFTVGEGALDAPARRRCALDAAESIHSDIARGFIRCEVIRWDDLLEAGSHAEAAKRGLQRLEGKTYVVQDGDVLNIRFNVCSRPRPGLLPRARPRRPDTLARDRAAREHDASQHDVTTG